MRTERNREPVRAISIVLHDLSSGGTERIAIRLANRWAEMGRRVRLICGCDQGPLRTLVSPAVDLQPLHPAAPRGPGSRGRMTRAVAEVLQHDPCDLLFLPGNYHLQIAESVATLPARSRPCVVAQLSNPLRREDRGVVGQALFEGRMRWRMRHVTSAMALTDAARREADEVLGRRMTQVLPLPALEDAEPAPVATPPGPPVILAIGRLVEQKDFRLAIEAFAQLSTPEARLVILGDGPERSSLAALIADLGLGDRVALAGYVADIRPWLDRARALLLTSRFEGYGAVVVEALAAGRPVVATPSGGAVAELLSDPRAGIVTPSRTAQALAAALDRQLAAPPPDPETLADLVQRFRIGPLAAAYLDAFDAARARMTAAGAAAPSLLEGLRRRAWNQPLRPGAARVTPAP